MRETWVAASVEGLGNEANLVDEEFPSQASQEISECTWKTVVPKATGIGGLDTLGTYSDGCRCFRIQLHQGIEIREPDCFGIEVASVAGGES